MVEFYRLSCPNCAQSLRIRDEYAGLKVACKHCGAAFVFDPKAVGVEPEAGAQTKPLVAPAEQPDPAMQVAVERLESENTKLRDELNAALRVSVSSKKTLAEAIAERDRLISAIDASVKEVKTLTSDLADARRTLADEPTRRDAVLEKQRVEFAAVHQERDSARAADSAESSRALAAIEKEHESTLQSVRDEFQAARQEWDANHATLLAQAEERERASTSSTERFTKEVESLRTQLADAIDRAKAEDLRFHSELDAARNEIEVLRGDLTRVRGEHEFATSDAGPLATERLRLISEHESARAAHAAEVAHLSSERDTHSSQADAFRREVEEMARLLDQTRSDLDAGRLALSDHEETIAGLHIRAEANEAQVQALTKELESAVADSAEVSERLASAQTAVQALELELSESKKFKNQIRTFLSGLGIRLPD